MLPKKVKIVEVGPRDGLQNEKEILATDIKIELVNLLSKTGLSNIEVGSFVSAKYIAQMHDTYEVLQKITRSPSINYSVLVPNDKGMAAAIENKADSIAIFTAASETFCQKNINCNIDESIVRFTSVTANAKKYNIPVRGYISCVLGCPYEGTIDVNKVINLAEKLMAMGCYEISLGDTIGIGNIKQVQTLISKLQQYVALDKIAVHFHDTYGQALVNVYSALELGVSIVDSAVAGLGGCPYAKGSSGNLATEDLLYMLNGLEINTGVDLDKIIKVGDYITKKLNILPRSKVALARQS